MPRARDPNRDKALEIFLQHSGEITNRRIAEIIQGDEKVVAVWKQRDKWKAKLSNLNVVQQSEQHSKERCTTKRKKKPGAPKGNRNAAGNPGGGAPEANQNATKHGLFARYLPRETLQIVEEMQGNKPSMLELLWEQIQIQYAVILRAQQIMYVRDQQDITKEVKKRESVETGGEGGFSVEKTEWEIQFAWDKHATFMLAQSKAMQALQKLIEQYEKMANGEQQLRIEKLKAEIARIKGNPEEEHEDDGFLEALGSVTKDVWADYETED